MESIFTKLLRVAIVALASLFVADGISEQAHADCRTWSNEVSGSCDDSMIKELLLSQNGNAIIFLDEGTDEIVNLPCTPSWGGRAIILASDNSFYNEYYSWLLTAFYSKQPVTIRIVAGEETCTLLNMSAESSATE